MRNEFSFRLRLGLMASACGVLLAFAGVAHAQQAADDEEDDTFEQRIIKNILGGIGADVGRNKGIDYRERSPLVIPPSLDLRPPEQAAAVRNPAWPREMERKKKSAAQNRPNVRAGAEDPGSSSAMTPDELRRAPAGRKGAGSGAVAESDPMQGRALRPSELGSTGSIFSWSSLTGSYKDESAKFEGEPGRGSLTQPPSGYQTPSSAYPYGVGNESSGPGWKIPTILDRPVGQEK